MNVLFNSKFKLNLNVLVCGTVSIQKSKFPSSKWKRNWLLFPQLSNIVTDGPVVDQLITSLVIHFQHLFHYSHNSKVTCKRNLKTLYLPSIPVLLTINVHRPIVVMWSYKYQFCIVLSAFIQLYTQITTWNHDEIFPVILLIFLNLYNSCNKWQQKCESSHHLHHWFLPV